MAATETALGKQGIAQMQAPPGTLERVVHGDDRVEQAVIGPGFLGAGAARLTGG